MRLQVLALLAVFSLPVPLMADTVYTYTGNDFTSATSPFTTSESLTGSFTVASPLGDDLENANVDPISFSFSVDGSPLTLSSTTPGIGDMFDVSTNASGDITEWTVVLNASSYFIDTQFNGGSGVDNVILSESSTATTGDVGTWTSNAPPPVPEPSTLVLLGSGLAGLVEATRRRVRS